MGHEDVHELYKLTRRYVHPDRDRMLAKLKLAIKPTKVTSIATNRHIEAV